MIELYINDERVDLKPGEPIAITKQVVDIQGLEGIKGDRTNTFVVPFTDRNRRIFEYIENVGSQSSAPYNRLPAKLVQNGVEVFPKAYAAINSASDGYRIALYSGNVVWASLLQGKKIRDLNYYADAHVWNLANIQASHTTPGLNYLYPRVAYGSLISDPSSIRPWVYAKSILSKIFEEIGYTVTGDIFSDPRFDRMHIECSRLEQPNEMRLAHAKVDEAAGYVDIIETASQSQRSYLRFPTEVFDPQESFNPPGVIEEVTTPDSQRFQYNYTETGTYNWEMYLVFEHVNAVLGTTVYPSNNSPDYVIYSSTTQYSPVPSLAYIPAGGFFKGGVPKLVKFTTYATQGQVEHLYIAPRPPQLGVGGNSWAIRLSNESYIRVTNSSTGETTVFGDLINPGLMLPDISQTDFVKSICMMFGVVPVPNLFNQSVELKFWNDLLKNRPNALDWSDKVDTNEPPEVSFRLSGWAQKNYFRYEPTDNTPVEHGDGVIETTGTLLPAERDVIKLPFGATGTKNLIPYIYRYVYDPDTFSYNWENDDAPRVMVYEEDAGTFLGVSPYLRSYFRSEAGDTLPLGFNDNLLSEYYEPIRLILENPKVVRRSFFMTLTDISELDPFVPVFVRQDGAYYIVNKPVEWIEGQSTKVELIRM